MVIDSNLLLKAKEVLGDRNADIIAENMGLSGYDPKTRSYKDNIITLKEYTDMIRKLDKR